jgi:hypothetical protein
MGRSHRFRMTMNPVLLDAASDAVQSVAERFDAHNPRFSVQADRVSASLGVKHRNGNRERRFYADGERLRSEAVETVAADVLRPPLDRLRVGPNPQNDGPGQFQTRSPAAVCRWRCCVEHAYQIWSTAQFVTQGER